MSKNLSKGIKSDNFAIAKLEERLLYGKQKRKTIAVAIARRAITVWEAIQKRTNLQNLYVQKLKKKD